MTGENSLSGRWAARKQAVLAEQQAKKPPSASQDLPEQQPEPEKTEAEVLHELGLPDPDDMQPGDDFSAFMKAAVPATLRNRALRSLWRSNSALANLDGLLDYGEDFTQKGTAGEVIKTAYQVGKGIVKKLNEVADEPLSDSEITKAESPEKPKSPAAAVKPPATKPDLTPVATTPIEVAPSKPEGQTPRKRMVFRFENS